MRVTGLHAHAFQAAEYKSRDSSSSSSRNTVSSCSNGGDGSAAASTSTAGIPVVLLHGFMGSTADWQPLMSALAADGHPCLAVNLPGHGGTAPVPGSTTGSTSSSSTAGSEAIGAGCYSIAAAAAAVEGAAAAAFGPGTPCLLVGYSMGARVVLQLALKQQEQQQRAGGTGSRVQWAGAVVISGTPGMPDADLRAARVQKDAELASMLTLQGSARFLEWWYQQPLWASLRQHPGFSRLLQQRQREQLGQEQQLAAALQYGSTGRMVSAALAVG
ncbi:Alpha/Beta hydrolase protein [Scenedesmus sp. NREL 46B-D3]|nr:Alpha/Beta hydrolase protein [Scenedesmus sp. NREL 46B-D3]